MLFGEQAWTSHSTLTLRPDNLALPRQLQTLGLSGKGLQAAPGSLGTEGNTGGQAGRCSRNSTKGFLFSSHLAEGRPRRQWKEQDGVPKVSGAWIRQCTPHTVTTTTLDPKRGR